MLPILRKQYDALVAALESSQPSEELLPSAAGDIERCPANSQSGACSALSARAGVPALISRPQHRARAQPLRGRNRTGGFILLRRTIAPLIYSGTVR